MSTALTARTKGYKYRWLKEFGYSGVDLPARCVAVEIYNESWDYGQRADITREQISERLNERHPDTIGKDVQRLCTAGWIDRTRVGKRGGFSTYRLRFPDGWTPKHPDNKKLYGDGSGSDVGDTNYQTPTSTSSPDEDTNYQTPTSTSSVDYQTPTSGITPNYQTPTSALTEKNTDNNNRGPDATDEVEPPTPTIIEELRDKIPGPTDDLTDPLVAIEYEGWEQTVLTALADRYGIDPENPTYKEPFNNDWHKPLLRATNAAQRAVADTYQGSGTNLWKFWAQNQTQRQISELSSAGYYTRLDSTIGQNFWKPPETPDPADSTLPNFVTNQHKQLAEKYGRDIRAYAQAASNPRITSKGGWLVKALTEGYEVEPFRTRAEQRREW